MISKTSDHLQRSSRRFAVRDAAALWIMRHGHPRLAVAFALVAGAAVGLACSIALRCCGLTLMWLRYPLALAASYLVFICVLGPFVRRAARRLETRRDQIRRDALRLQFDRNDSDLPDSRKIFDSLPDDQHDVGQEGMDPRAIPLFLTVLLAITVILVCAYYIWMAPVLLADIAVEGALVGWLYRPGFRGTGAGWLPVALEQTGMPAVLLALAFAATGVGFQHYAPQATCVAEVWEHVLQQQNLAAVDQKARPR